MSKQKALDLMVIMVSFIILAGVFFYILFLLVPALAPFAMLIGGFVGWHFGNVLKWLTEGDEPDDELVIIWKDDIL